MSNNQQDILQKNVETLKNVDFLELIKNKSLRASLEENAMYHRLNAWVNSENGAIEVIDTKVADPLSKDLKTVYLILVSAYDTGKTKQLIITRIDGLDESQENCVKQSIDDFNKRLS